jgi:hypothetical protein
VSWQLQDAIRQCIRWLRSDGAAFKRFLVDGPPFDVLGIERASDSARAVEL